MLFMVASQVQAFAKLFEENFQPEGDLILFIVADEECGGEFGAKWVIENKPESLNIGKRNMYAVTESGGISVAPGKLSNCDRSDRRWPQMTNNRRHRIPIACDNDR